MGKKITLLIWVFCGVMIFNTAIVFAASGSIVGVVTDETTGDALPGANVFIEGTVLGAATDIGGHYVIPKVDPGSYKLVASFIGYKKKVMDVNVGINRKVTVDIKLEYAAIEADQVVVVTAQAEGQMAAINQQLSARSIKNIVSEARVRELPDANAAESLGRLSGVAIDREGGEASGVVVRGQKAGGNTVYVDGMRMTGASGDGNSRGVGLANISSQMIGGIELQKSFTPDNDGDVSGGGITFRLKEADPGLHTDVFLRQGYNGFTESTQMNDVSVTIGDRFFRDKLGVLVNYSFDQKDRSTDYFSAGYNYRYAPNPSSEITEIYPTNASLRKREETRKRHGVTYNIDYIIPNGKIRAKGFFANMDKHVEENTNSFKNYNADHGLNYDGSIYDQESSSFLTGLSGEHELWGMKADWNIYHSNSELDRPDSLAGHADKDGGSYPIFFDVTAQDVIQKGNDGADISLTTFGSTEYSNVKSNATEDAIKLDFEVPYKISNHISGYIKFGGKYRDTQREFKQTGGSLAYGSEYDPDGLRLIKEAFPDWTFLMSKETSPHLGYVNFIKDLDPHDFGQEKDLKFYYPMDFDKLRTIYNATKSSYVKELYLQSYNYDNRERFSAAYIMTGIDIGPYVTFTPGLRFESLNSETDAFKYKAYLQQKAGHVKGKLTPVSSETNNDIWLPMFNLKIKPREWLDIRAAATKTLQRPGFISYSPRERISSALDVWRGNPDLKPQTNWNYDLNFSFFENHLGLFTLGGFYKRIHDQVKSYTVKMLDPAEFGYTPDYKNQEFTTYINNPWDGKIKGLEVDWQTHLWYLPAMLKGLVFNINYTYMTSETKYPSFDTKTEYSYVDGKWQYVWSGTDSSRSNTVMNSPNEMLKLSFGYDMGGFSSRVSMYYQGTSLSWAHTDYRTLDVNRDKLVRWDLQVSQKIYDHFQLYLDANNFTDWPDREFMAFHPENKYSEQTYGWTGDVGIRYRF